jgi:GMP synthase (glutamine-hydrolysing)
MPNPRLLVLVTGGTLPAVEERRGDFARMFTEGLRAGVPEAHVECVDCMQHEEHDPLPALHEFAGVVMTGSPAMVGEDAGWMRWGVRVIERCLADGVPYLGVCFGHQMLGVALGADVGANPSGREMGTVEVTLTPDDDDPLLGALPARFSAQVTHVDVIRAPGSRLAVKGTAPHDGCHVVRAGDVTWGVQFHPELDDQSITTYIDARRHLLDSEHGPGAADKRLQHVAPSPEAMSLLGRFARLCSSHPGREWRHAG